MRRALHIGDEVCLREEAVAASYPGAQPHVPCKVVDRYGNGLRTVLAIDVPWREPSEQPMLVWPSEVWLANGVGERLWARKCKMRAQIEAEKAAKRRTKKRKTKKRSKH